MVNRATKPSAIPSRQGMRAGAAEVMAATPAATDTETVNT